MGSSKQETNTSQNQSATTAPWQPTQGILNDIISGIGSQTKNYNLTGAENNAIDTITQNASNVPNYGSQAQGVANTLIGGGTNYSPQIQDALTKYTGYLTPYASGQNLDPTQNPATAALLDKITNSVSSNVNSMFAGAGRDLSGMNQKALASGLSQGLAEPLFNQYNQNVNNQINAANGLLSGTVGATGAMQNADQTRYGNMVQGLDVGMNTVPQAANTPAMAQLSAGQLARSLPLQNLGLLEGLTIPIAGLGSQATGKADSNSVTTGKASPLQTIMGLSTAWKNFGFGG